MCPFHQHSVTPWIQDARTIVSQKAVNHLVDDLKTYLVKCTIIKTKTANEFIGKLTTFQSIPVSHGRHSGLLWGRGMSWSFNPFQWSCRCLAGVSPPGVQGLAFPSSSSSKGTGMMEKLLSSIPTLSLAENRTAALEFPLASSKIKLPCSPKQTLSKPTGGGEYLVYFLAVQKWNLVPPLKTLQTAHFHPTMFP